MAKKDDEDELIKAAERRRARTGRSFFPAANRGIVLSREAMMGIPSERGMEISADFPQGETLVPVGGSRGGRALPPEQNPAYQAAIAKGRPDRGQYTMIPTSTGFMSVPISQVSKYSAIINKTEPQVAMPRLNLQAAYALGNTGAIPTGNTPFEKSYRMGYEGGAVQRPEAPGFGYNIGQSVANLASGSGRRIAGLFRRPIQVAQYPNYYDYNPSPVPEPPRRYSDLY